MTKSLVDAHTHKLSHINHGLGLYHVGLQEILKSEIPSVSRWGVGLHPWWLQTLSSSEREECWEKIMTMAARATVIGETGIDRARKELEIDLQREWVSRHLLLEPTKPLVLHNVRAGSDLLALIPVGIQRPLLLHDYNGGIEETRQWLKRTAYFSFGSVFKRMSEKAMESLRFIPRDRLLLETDDSDVPLGEIYKLAAQALEVDDLNEQIFVNFQNFLGQKS